MKRLYKASLEVVVYFVHDTERPGAVSPAAAAERAIADETKWGVRENIPDEWREVTSDEKPSGGWDNTSLVYGTHEDTTFQEAQDLYGARGPVKDGAT